jgi:hypothetical protein
MIAMRAMWIVVALVACHRADAPATVAPKRPTPCARASDNMVQTMLDRLSSKDAPPTEEADAFRNLIRERCEQDSWSAEATQCLIAMKSLEDAAGCATLMTDEQQAALVRDETARFGTGPAAPAPGVPPAEPAASPPPSGAPRKD